MESCPHEKCDYQTESYKGLKVHYSKRHDGSIAGEEYVCDNCGDKFRRRPSAVVSEKVYCDKECKDESQQNRVSVNCNWCGSELDRVKSRADGNNFCDISCRDSYNTDNNTTLVNCDYCDSPTRKQNWRLRRSENLFCNPTCQAKFLSGENNGNWSTDREHINKRSSAEYYEWERKVFERDNYICQDCGSDDKQLTAHHIEYASESPEKIFDVTNGISLCHECHTERHKGENVYHAMKSSFN